MQTKLGMISRKAPNRTFRALQFAFGTSLIMAGLDKYFHVLTDWDQYLCPIAVRALGNHLHLFMSAVGIGEICLGIGLTFKPRAFNYLTSAWLFLIIVNLLLSESFFDIALQDFVLALTSAALGPLSQALSKTRPLPAVGIHAQPSIRSRRFLKSS
ncbi:MAG: hypothetical protein P4M08_03260 [Oligoflexia bacterium]|nr:hypothetical protein [Oligoflexia bacterium]